MPIINKRGVFEFLTKQQEIKKLNYENKNLIKTLIKGQRNNNDDNFG